MTRLLPLILLLASFSVFAQSSQLSGRVLNAADKSPLPGVNVFIKGTSAGTITDAEGRFEIQVSAASTIVFSFIGYRTQEILYTGQTILDITMEEDIEELGEVVVLGYQSVNKRSITGAVTTVKGESVKDLSMSSFEQGLSGQAAGVQITQSSGTPGGGVQMRIRGVTSLGAGNRPLVIVDGVPVETGGLSGRDFGGQEDNALALISPGDIESWQFLQDASAKAQYGSRASNGVLIITTKRGKKGASKISFDAQRGIIDPVHTLDLLNSTELLSLQREAVRNAGRNPDALGLIPGVTDAVDTNWQNEVLRRAIMEQYTVTASGGDDITQFYLSGNYRKEEGVQLNNSFERMGTTINFDHNLTRKFKLFTKIQLARSFNKRVKGDNFLDGVYSGAIKSLPYNVPYDETGVLVGPGSPLYAGFPNFNPVAQALLPRFNVVTVKTNGFLKGEYSINDDLKLVGQIGIDYNDVKEDNYESSQTAIGGYLASVGGQGYGVFNASASSIILTNARAEYKKIIDKHSINALGAIEVLQETATGGSVTGRLFTSDDFTYINSAGLVDNGGSYRVPKHSLVSYIASVIYDYDDRFLATLSGRADGSSNFGANNKFGYFPALSVGWRISNEKFFNPKVVNDLKLRASIGLTGNERITQFSYLGLWTSTTYNGSSGVRPSSIDNPDIKWESTREMNGGVDMQLLEGRIQVKADVYNNFTYDLLLGRPYALTTGFASVRSNIGTMRNRGFEFSVTSVNIDGALKWTTRLNVSRNQNKIISLNDSIPIFTGYTAQGVDRTNIVKEGYPIGSFYGLNYLGVNPATGDAIYEDRNKDGQITNADAMVIGNSQAKLYGGITNTFSYKGFDVNLSFNFSWGNQVLNLTKSGLVNMGADIQSNQLRESLRRWQKPGDITDIPRYEFGNTTNNFLSNRILEDASYLRLKNLSIGYNIPVRLISRFKVQGVRIYASATNLWTWTKYSGSDPEVSTLDGSTSAQGIDFYTLPQVRTIAGGLTISL